MPNIVKKDGRKGPYYMSNVGGVVYASQNEEDVKAFLNGEQVEQTQTSDTWFWVKRLPKSDKPQENGDVKKRIRELSDSLSELVKQL